MTPQLVRRGARLGALDFFLAGVSAAAATFSAGQGLSSPGTSTIFVFLIALGTTLSMLVHRQWRPERRGPSWGIPYAVSLVAAAVLSLQLNQVLPDEGFPLQLIMGGALCWMLVFGSFTAWRDGSLLFQVVPGIAMFGMVGTWDTFKEAPLTFFGFLLCVAALFARSHARRMLEQARAAGFLDTVEDRSKNEYAIMQEGPWRWMAGPEWALASAALVVLVSLIGAPVLQESVQGVAGAVRVNVPVPKTNRSNLSFPSSRSGSVDVGQGPRALGSQVVLRAKLDRQRYLRGQIYTTYTGAGWAAPAMALNRSDPVGDAVREIPHRRQIRFEIELVGGSHISVPAPGVVTQISGMRRVHQRSDGTLELDGVVTVSPTLNGRAVVPANEDDLATGNAGLSPSIFMGDALNVDNVPAKVFEFAQKVTEGAGTDYAKATAIKAAIEEQCTYDLYAEAVPTGADAVETFLFNQPSGYCDLFASSMVILARSSGIPARYVTGYYPFVDTLDTYDRFNVRESDAHAWAELYFADVGWVAFDATEGARTAEGSHRGDAIARAWFATPLGIVCILALLGAGGGSWFLFGGRTRRVDPTRRDAETDACRVFLHAIERATGKPRRPAQSASQYIAQLAPILGAHTAAAQALNTDLERALFGPERLDETGLKDLQTRVTDLRKALKD